MNDNIEKIKEASKKVYLARMIKDFSLHTAQEAFEQGLKDEEFVDPSKFFALKFVAPYKRKGRKDKKSDGVNKPKVHVNAFLGYI